MSKPNTGSTGPVWIMCDEESGIISTPPIRSELLLSKGGYLRLQSSDPAPNWFWRKMQYLFFGFIWESK